MEQAIHRQISAKMLVKMESKEVYSMTSTVQEGGEDKKRLVLSNSLTRTS